MFVALIPLVLAFCVWGCLYVNKGNVYVTFCSVLVCGYVAGHFLFNVKVGPIPITSDRVLVGAALSVLLVQWKRGQLTFYPLRASEWLVLAVVLLFTASALTAGEQSVVADDAKPMWRLVMSIWLPALAYLSLRVAPLKELHWRIAQFMMAGLGVYLALTAVAEATGTWALVWPRYIRDPLLGMHFGRARGPLLNSVSLGIYLTACMWSICALLPHAGRVSRLLLLASLPLLPLGVFLTSTRSTWIGLAVSIGAVTWFILPSRLRLPVLGGGTMAGMLLLAVAWSAILDIKREGETGDSQHSVQQRAAFAYVSWEMFKDHPITGVGFGRFYDKKLPYLSDRRQAFELESLRKLHHHNSFLSIVTETGIIGTVIVVALMTTLLWDTLNLIRLAPPFSWHALQALAGLAGLLSFSANALFHDLTLTPTEMLLLAIPLGVNSRLIAQYRERSFAGSGEVRQRATAQDLASMGLAPATTSL